QQHDGDGSGCRLGNLHTADSAVQGIKAVCDHHVPAAGLRLHHHPPGGTPRQECPGSPVAAAVNGRAGPFRRAAESSGGETPCTDPPITWTRPPALTASTRNKLGSCADPPRGNRGGGRPGTDLRADAKLRSCASARPNR